jgi:hypothetical protein
MEWRSWAADVVAIRPGPIRWGHAVQGGIAVLLPGLLFIALGQPTLALAASNGGFLALYLGGLSRTRRAKLLPIIGVGLFAAVALALVGAQAGVAGAVISVSVLGVLATILTVGWGVGPPGALFFVLLAGAFSTLGLAEAERTGRVDFAGVLGPLATGLVLAYAIVVAPLLLRSVRQQTGAAPGRSDRLQFSLRGQALVILVRVTVAVAVAATIGLLLGEDRAYWIVITVVAVLQTSARRRMSAIRAGQRLIGTVVGLGVFALLALLPLTELTLLLIIGVLQTVIELVIARNYGLALAFITPLALLVAAQSDPGDVGAVVGERVVDTVIGVLIAVVVVLIEHGWVTRRSRDREARQSEPDATGDQPHPA